MNRPKLFTLPNAITLCSLNLGAFATLRAVRPDASGLRDAALAILAAALCDGLDGRVARALKEANALGAELDSLADLVSFGIAPAALAQGWALCRVAHGPTPRIFAMMKSAVVAERPASAAEAFTAPAAALRASRRAMMARSLSILAALASWARAWEIA